LGNSFRLAIFRLPIRSRQHLSTTYEQFFVILKFVAPPKAHFFDRKVFALRFFPGFPPSRRKNKYKFSPSSGKITLLCNA